MKNILIILCTIALSHSIASSQRIGFKGGLNFTNVSSEKDLDVSTSNGFHAGLLVEFSLLTPINISTGLFYTRRGYKSNQVDKDGNVSIDYLDIPIDLMLHFQLAELVGAYVSAGPYFSYGLNSSVFGEDGILTNGYSQDDLDLNRMDSGIKFGLGVDFLKFRLSTAYGISLTDNGAESGNQLENRVLSISVAYFLK